MLSALLGPLVGASGAGAFEWRESDPAAEGLSPEGLERLWDDLAGRGTEALLVIRHDAVVFERYQGGGRHQVHYTASLAKALVGGMGLALVIDGGWIRPEDLAARYVPAWQDDPQRAMITVAHLAAHLSGIEDAEQDDLPHDRLPGWKGEFWRRQQNPLVIARDSAPVLDEPGTRLRYSNPGIAMLGWCLAAALREAPEADLKRLLAARLMNPIGVGRDEWRISYDRSWETEGLTLYAPWGGGTYSPDAVARVGRLMLRLGDWDGQRLLAPATVRRVLAPVGAPAIDRTKDRQPCPGLGWWLAADGALSRLPRDAFLGAGAGHQLLLVVPSLELIVVRFGNTLAPGGFWTAVEQHLVNPLMDALVEVVPASPAVAGVEFAPAESVARAAIGSDNWPWTADRDGQLIVAYGDGWGFEPPLAEKLSLGFARVSGPPEGFRGENFRSPTGERLGDGPRGAKASGLLMVDGVLHMVVRNLDNSRLATSHDGGRTWTWDGRFETSFGCPVFVNYGPDYAGARDDFVYLLSPDGPSAYEPADAVVLARAPRDRAGDRSAYEFFAGLGPAGAPRWSADIEDRFPVLRRPRGCLRPDAVFHPGLNRYLMALGFNHDGGWGIYDASEPWGPWTRVFETEDWGLGGTHGYRLPGPWISPDGRTLYLVFSGREHGGVEYDAFCVRRLTLRPR